MQGCVNRHGSIESWASDVWVTGQVARQCEVQGLECGAKLLNTWVGMWMAVAWVAEHGWLSMGHAEPCPAGGWASWGK